MIYLAVGLAVGGDMQQFAVARDLIPPISASSCACTSVMARLQ